MESNYLYLFINIAAFIVPFLCSFYRPAPFFKKWRYVIPAIVVSGVLFVVWDAVFTRHGIWGFNKNYLFGVSFFGLPLEEILFFFCIPYACLFTYFALNRLIARDFLFPARVVISVIIGLALICIGILSYDKLYTAVTFILTGLTILWLGVRQRAPWLGRFYFSFIVLQIPFLIVNGALTGLLTTEPVVWYNDQENLGIRITTIPVEDVVYALLMLLVPIALWETWESPWIKRTK